MLFGYAVSQRRARRGGLQSAVKIILAERGVRIHIFDKLLEVHVYKYVRRDQELMLRSDPPVIFFKFANVDLWQMQCSVCILRQLIRVNKS